MGQKVALVMLGLLIGLVIATSIPAEAHHRKSARRLRNQVSNLRERVASLENRVSSLSSRMYSAESDINAAESDISGLERRTGKLSTFGDYTGDVDGSQVEPPGICGYRDPAVWSFSELRC